MGQSWAWQVGLGRIFPREETLTALRSLWRYNFAPDAGRYHEQVKGGRWYAMPGEAGLFMCTFPKPDWDLKKAAGKGPAWAAFYFNECMTGFEHQVASHMIAEGMAPEGLAVLRAIHDRYSVAKRNPFNEVECGDHYSRAMASYGSFVTMCGFEYDGPKGQLAFAPRLTPEKFRAAFTSARGWGSYAQETSETGLKAELTLKWGTLSLNVLTLQPIGGLQAKTVRASVDGRPLAASLEAKDDRLHVRLAEPLVLTAGQHLETLLA